MLLSKIDVVTPSSLDDALRILHEKKGRIRIIAGGSDMILQLKDGIVKADELLNIMKLRELRYIRKSDGNIHIGSLSTYSDIIESDITRKHAPCLVDAAKTIGAIQLQNTATVGGNLGNASPAGDSLPPLYALDAKVVLRSAEGRREVRIEDFFQGYRKTALKPDELIEEVYFRAMEPPEESVYVKLGLRSANAISIVDIAIWAVSEPAKRMVRDVRIALGAVAPTIVRARKCEESARNILLDEDQLRRVSRIAGEEAAPISDIRGSAAYRRDMISSLVYQGLHELIGRNPSVND